MSRAWPGAWSSRDAGHPRSPTSHPPGPGPRRTAGAGGYGAPSRNAQSGGPIPPSREKSTVASDVFIGLSFVAVRPQIVARLVAPMAARPRPVVVGPAAGPPDGGPG